MTDNTPEGLPPDHMFDSFFGKDVRVWETILPLQATPTKPDVVFTNGVLDADFSKMQFDLEKEISQQLQEELADLPRWPRVWIANVSAPRETL